MSNIINFNNYGKIGEDCLAEANAMARKGYYLSKHPYSIWNNEDLGFWYTYIPDDNSSDKRKLIKRKNKSDIENIIVDYWEQKELTYPLLLVAKQAIEERHSLGFISNSTRDKYLADANRFFTNHSSLDIKELDEDGLTELIEAITSKGNLKHKAYSNLISLVRLTFTYARRNHISNVAFEDAISDVRISKNWFSDKHKEDSEEVFNEEETALLIKYLIDNLTNKRLCLLLTLLTGCRISEMTTAKHSDFVENVFQVRRCMTRFKDEKGKYHYEVKDSPKTSAGNRDVVIPADYLWLVEKTKEYNPNGEYVFLDQNNKPYSSNVMNNELKKICDRLGIPRRSPHKLRKTYVSICYDSGMDEKTITRQVGHTDFRTTNGYYNRNRKSVNEVFEVVSNISEFRLG